MDCLHIPQGEISFKDVGQLLLLSACDLPLSVSLSFLLGLRVYCPLKVSVDVERSLNIISLFISSLKFV